MRPNVGRRVIASGFWESAGKVSGYVRGKDRLVGGVIYVKSTTDAGVQMENALAKRIKDGTAVEVTGTLRLYEQPPVVEPAAPEDPEKKVAQTEITHFYFAVEEAEVKPLRQ